MEEVVAPPGLHEQDGLPALVVAVNVTEPPTQVNGLLTETVGSANTVAVPEPEPVHAGPPVWLSVTVHV